LLAIVISGDGGWRDLDRTIAEKLRSQGVSIVGWNSLRYLWSLKTPAQVAYDLGAVIDTYAARWGPGRHRPGTPYRQNPHSRRSIRQ
jgi:type IV secretory pathway VirJ component